MSPGLAFALAATAIASGSIGAVMAARLHARLASTRGGPVDATPADLATAAARVGALEATLADADARIEEHRTALAAERALGAEERCRGEAAQRLASASTARAAAADAEVSGLRDRLGDQAAALAKSEERIAVLDAEVGRLGPALAAAQTAREAEERRGVEALAVERRRGDDQMEALAVAEGAMSEHFQAMSAHALDQANARLLAVTEERFGAAQAVGAADLDARASAVGRMVGPLGELLGRVDARLQSLEVARAESQGVLLEQVRSLGDAHDRLRAETANLVTALRAPSTRGRWGELHLRRVVELAGLERHCDFDEQVRVNGPDGGLRPDLVVRMPGGLSVVVDAKVPLEAYLRALDAPDEARRKAAFNDHARQLRVHVETLAAKGYWEAFDPSPEAVVLFVPGDAILAAACEADPSLIELAATKNVVLASPSNLILLLRTVAVAWRQEAITENARKVSRLGRELYKRLGTLSEHLDKAGRGLDRAVASYNDAVGSLEARVLVTARQLVDLDVADGELITPEQVTRDTRRLGSVELAPAGRGGRRAAPALQAVADTPQLPLGERSA